MGWYRSDCLPAGSGASTGGARKLRDVGHRVMGQGDERAHRPVAGSCWRPRRARLGRPQPQVRENAPDDARVLDQGDDSPEPLALRTLQGIGLVDFADEARPGGFWHGLPAQSTSTPSAPSRFFPAPRPQAVTAPQPRMPPPRWSRRHSAHEPPGAPTAPVQLESHPMPAYLRCQPAAGSAGLARRTPPPLSVPELTPGDAERIEQAGKPPRARHPVPTRPGPERVQEIGRRDRIAGPGLDRGERLHQPCRRPGVGVGLPDGRAGSSGANAPSSRATSSSSRLRWPWSCAIGHDCHGIAGWGAGGMKG